MADTNPTNVTELTENTDEIIRERANTSDKNTIAMLSDIIRAYHAIGLLSDGERDEVDALDSDSKKLTFLKNKIPRLTPELKLAFCDAFVGDDMESFHGATPAILAEAYRAAYAKAKEDESQKERLQKIAAHIDSLSVEFANSGGMLIDGKVVDTTNAADVYEGFADMLNARMGDIDKIEGDISTRGSQITAKKREMAALGVALNDSQVATCHSNLSMLEGSITEYDDMWGLSQITEDNASKLEKRWDKLFDKLARAEVFDETKEIISKYKFLDADGKEMPQYKRNGRRIIKEGRLYTIMELARHNVLRRHVGKFDERINADALEEEFNNEILFLLYNMKTYGQLADAATDDPELFMDYTKRDAILNGLAQEGGDISDVSYNAMLNAHTNATGGWLARVKNKVGDTAKEDKKEDMDRFFEKAGTINGVGARNEKRLALFKRILKGFLSAFVASAIITGIATAAAAAAGMSVAMALAITGIVTALGISLAQIFRWKKAQEAAGRPVTWEEFKKDKRLLTSLGVSGLAAIAMAFGAAGLAEASMILGFGALGLGGYKNAHEAYKDARRSMSAPRAAVWAVTNALAVIGGGIMGRVAAHGLINMYNEAHPTNKVFQKPVPDTEPQDFQGTRDVPETRIYTQEGLDNAEAIVKTWYQDNPDLLQARVDAINAYNAEHGTAINPYRAIMASADAGAPTYDNIRLHVENSHIDPNIHDIYSHGHHRIMTPRWGDAYGFSKAELDTAAQLFQGDSAVINPDAMEVVGRLDAFISETNTIGTLDGAPIQTDGYFEPNDPRGWTSYTGGEPALVEQIDAHPEPYTYTEDVPVTRFVPVDEGINVAAYGNYNPQDPVEELRDRVGAFIDKIRKPEPEPEPVDDDQKLLGPGDHKEPLLLGPGRDDRLLGPVYEDDDQLLLGPGRKDDEQLLLGPGRDDRLLGPGHKDDNQLLLGPGRDVRLLGPGRKDDEQLLLGPGRDDRLLIEPVLQEEVERVLGVTRPQAHDWVKWHEQLKAVEEKLAKSPKSPVAAKLQREKKTLQQNIAHLRNQLGGASDTEIERGVEVALKREEQRMCMDELEKLRAKAKSKNESRFDKAARERKEQELMDKFQKLYKELAKYDIYYPFPIEGVQARKQSERDAVIEDAEIIEEVETPIEEEEIIEDIDLTEEAKPEPVSNVAQDIDWSKYQSPFAFEQSGDVGDQMESDRRTVPGIDIASMLKKQEPKVEEKTAEKHEPEKPKKVNDLVAAVEEAYGRLITAHDEGRKYFVPAELEKLADEGNITTEPIGTYNGLPFSLVDINGNGDPFAESQDGTVVIVDWQGIRIPFVLSTGLNPNNPVAPGKWYPVSNVVSSGSFYNPSHNMEQRRYEQEVANREEHVAEYGMLMEMAEVLDQAIGDIRNWEDIEKTKQYHEKGGASTGFVGGCDVVPEADTEAIMDELGKSTYYYNDVDHMVYSSSPMSVTRDKATTYRALHRMEDEEWRRENENLFGKLRRGVKRAAMYIRQAVDSAERSFRNLFGIRDPREQ